MRSMQIRRDRDGKVSAGREGKHGAGRTLLLATLFLLLAAGTWGCMFRYGEPTVIAENTSSPEVAKLSARQAKQIIEDALLHPPAGHRPNNPGWLRLGEWATEVRLKEHLRTGFILVEVMDGRRRVMEFYVNNTREGQRFANALWRAKLEAEAAAKKSGK